MTQTPTVDPAAKPAVDAYLAFYKATTVAEQHPWDVTGKPPAGGDFTKYSVTPAEGEEFATVINLARAGVEFRGTPPTPRVSVLAVDQGAKPYPTVTLSDCPTPAPSWVLYDVKTNKPDTSAKPPKVAPPYQATVKVIYYEKQWTVQKIEYDMSRTCAA